MTSDKLAAWITFRPTPGKAERMDFLDAWECSLFINRGPIKSSSLVREASALTFALWGLPPIDGLITLVKPEKVATNEEVKGYCYRRAGWRHVETKKDGKLVLRCPWPNWLWDWRWWPFKPGRGYRLREFLRAEGR